MLEPSEPISHTHINHINRKEIQELEFFLNYHFFFLILGSQAKLVLGRKIVLLWKFSHLQVVANLQQMEAKIAQSLSNKNSLQQQTERTIYLSQ